MLLPKTVQLAATMGRWCIPNCLTAWTSCLTTSDQTSGRRTINSFGFLLRNSQSSGRAMLSKSRLQLKVEHLDSQSPKSESLQLIWLRYQNPGTENGHEYGHVYSMQHTVHNLGLLVAIISPRSERLSPQIYLHTFSCSRWKFPALNEICVTQRW